MSGDDFTPSRESTAPSNSFELGGRYRPLRPKVPYQLLRQSALGMQGDMGELVRSIEGLLIGAVAKSERAAFRAFLAEVPEDDEEVFTYEDLLRVFQEVAGRVANALFPQPSESAGSLNRRNTNWDFPRQARPPRNRSRRHSR